MEVADLYCLSWVGGGDDGAAVGAWRGGKKEQ